MKKIYPIFSLLIVFIVASILFVAPTQLFAPTVVDTYNDELVVGLAGEITTIRFWGTGYHDYYKFITLYNDDTSEQIDCEFASYTFINPIDPSEGVIQSDPWDIQMNNILNAGNYHYNLIISADWDMFNGEVYPYGTILLNEIRYFTITAPPAPAQTPPAPVPVVEPVWVRDVQMTCYQVWVNEDNAFEFVFWWEYRDNNWVKIYDMSGNEIFSIDMPYGDAHFIANLPDGMYTVKTFNVDSVTPIQIFTIGKP